MWPECALAGAGTGPAGAHQVERVQDLLGHMQKQESMRAGEVLGEHARERE